MFTNASGQKINLNKSGEICDAKVDQALRKNIFNVTHIPIWDSPEKYLGIPAEWGGSKIRGLKWLKDRVLAKLQGWKGNMLTQAGKEVLIKSIVQALATYIMSILYLLKTFYASLIARVAKFWWSTSGKQRGIHWNNVKTICSPKSMGVWVSKTLTR